MFKHILVPLDGSRLAEAALPTAAYLARTLGAAITLVHVIERDPPESVHGDEHLTEAAEAAAYLARTRERAFPAEAQVEWHVHENAVGDVARSLVEHIAELNPDLIILCTHGQGGLRDWLYGSIAQRVVGLGTVPVWLIRPTGEEPPAFACRRLLAPLDGQAEHEQGLRIAEGLARFCGAALHLLAVIYTPGTLPAERGAAGRLLPGLTGEILELQKEQAEGYLRQQITRLQKTGLKATGEISRGDPATSIIEVARQRSADLIALGTHGKSGLDAFWAGSIAPKISARSPVPLLLVPLHEEK
jgi:nucleotide-binding universal stress UspA family protein